MKELIMIRYTDYVTQLREIQLQEYYHHIHKQVMFFKLRREVVLQVQVIDSLMVLTYYYLTRDSLHGKQSQDIRQQTHHMLYLIKELQVVIGIVRMILSVQQMLQHITYDTVVMMRYGMQQIYIITYQLDSTQDQEMSSLQ